MKLYATVREVMNKDIKTVEPGDTIIKAAQIMKNENIGSVLIKGYPMGIVTATDILHKHVATRSGKYVKDIATTPVITISSNKSIEQAAKLMTERKIEKLPVIEGDKIIGIITATDILRFEPLLFEMLIEKIRIVSEPVAEEEKFEYYQCELCGNYSDDVEETGGKFLCSECRTEGTS